MDFAPKIDKAIAYPRREAFQVGLGVGIQARQQDQVGIDPFSQGGQTFNDLGVETAPRLFELSDNDLDTSEIPDFRAAWGAG